MAKTKTIYGVVTRDGKKSFWTRIGTAFVNSDGSLNLKFDYVPADLAVTTIQVRDPKEREEVAAA
jgi:hypothetical protein